MSTIEDGGPAFPVADMQSAKPGTIDELVAFARGLSLRDHFAGLAMQGFCARVPAAIGTEDEFAETAYRVADAMLKARATGAHHE